MNDAPTDQSRRVECPATNDPAVRLFIFAAMLIGFGVWCFLERTKYPPPEAWTLEHINTIVGYVLNNYGPWVLVPPGLVFVALGVRLLRRKLIADDEGIGYVGAQRIAWSDVTGLDSAKLKDKGVLTLHYGKGRKLVLDSWKLKNFRDLVALIEQYAPGKQ